MTIKKAVVLGAGGFIGHHLAVELKKRGYWVRGVDLKPPEFCASPADEFYILDLRIKSEATTAICPPVRLSEPFDEIYNLAADMGGIGFISSNFATICRNNSLINLNVLEAVRQRGCGRLFFSSSACVYPKHLQSQYGSVVYLKERQAYPADAEKGYGWEKLYAEMLYEYYREEFGICTRIARFHNIYGPLGTWRGGREKAPAAICRKVAEAYPGQSIEVWGAGNQIRSFCHIKDCVEGILRLMASNVLMPLNIGSEEAVTINELVEKVKKVAGNKMLTTKHDMTKPIGVQGRCSDNSLCQALLEWSPKISLDEGLVDTYEWIDNQVRAAANQEEAIT